MQKKIKILFIIDEIAHLNAGTEIQLARLINGLDKSSYDVHLYCLTPSDWIKKKGSQYLDCQISIFPCLRYRNPVTYYNILKLILSLRALKPQIVHTFFLNSNTLGVFAAHLAGTKCIISSRRDFGQWMNSLTLFFTKIANRFVSSIHANSQKVKELTEKMEGVNSDKIDVIYNGIDIDDFNIKMASVGRDIRKELCISSENKIVGIVANLRPMKHLDTFIRAVALVRERRKDISFVLVGEGPSRKYLEELSSKLHIGNNVYFVGRQDEVAPYLRSFDLAVNCSAQEGISNAIIEYMLAQIPCIVTASGGNTELIEHGWNGYTFPLNDHTKLASIMMSLIDDKEKQTLFIERAKEKIERNMAIEKMIKSFEKYYANLIEISHQNNAGLRKSN